MKTSTIVTLICWLSTGLFANQESKNQAINHALEFINSRFYDNETMIKYTHWSQIKWAGGIENFKKMNMTYKEAIKNQNIGIKNKHFDSLQYEEDTEGRKLLGKDQLILDTIVFFENLNYARIRQPINQLFMGHQIVDTTDYLIIFNKDSSTVVDESSFFQFYKDVIPVSISSIMNGVRKKISSTEGNFTKTFINGNIIKEKRK